MDSLRWPGGVSGKVVSIQHGEHIREMRTLKILQITREIDRLEGEQKKTLTFFWMTERYPERRRAQIWEQIKMLIAEKEALEALSRSPLPKR